MIISTYLWMIRPQYQPATKQKGNVENTSTYKETDDIRSRDFQSTKQHVVFVEVAKEP